MGWRRGESWFDTDWHSLEEPSGGGAASLELHAPSFFGLSPDALAEALSDGLAESRRRRAELRRKRDARKTRAAALVLGPAVALTIATPKPGAASRVGKTIDRDPPSETLRVVSAETDRGDAAAPRPAPAFAPVRWRNATSYGLPYAGSLSGGTQLPVEGPDWVTWHPGEDRVPNDPDRLYGNERTIRKLLAVLEGYRAARPEAPRVVVGDLSFRRGGPMNQHRSHQNGLDVDVYYPRRDGALRAPSSTRQIDSALAQELLDRFVAAGAAKVFVGYRSGLRGPRDVVVPYPNHEDHMHVRFPGRRP
jgi:murein endopeptidase